MTYTDDKTLFALFKLDMENQSKEQIDTYLDMIYSMIKERKSKNELATKLESNG